METEPELEQEEELELELETLVALVDGAGGGESTGGDKQTFEDEQKSSMIGKTITGYNPIFNAEADVKGGTIVEGKYTPEDKYTGREESDTEQGAFDTESLGWKIWSIDENNVYLISAKVTSAKLYLKGVQGYNNGVYILNETCKTCYTDSNYAGVEVRSMNIRDIEKLYDNNRGIMTFNYQGDSEYDTAPYSFKFKWPTAWTTYDETDAKPFEKRSKQDTLIESGSETQEQSEKSPRVNRWWKNFGSLRSYSGFADTEEAKGYASMIFDNGFLLLPKYWLASRYVRDDFDEDVTFGLENCDYR